MKNLETKLEELQRQLDEVKQQLSKPAFEVGKWYKSHDGTRLWHISEVHGEGQESYGFYEFDKWDNEQYRNSTISDFRPANDKEVEEALIKEFLRKNPIAPYRVKSLDSGGIYEFKKQAFSFNPNLNVLYIEDCGILEVFKNGKWAEILPSKKKMTIKEIESELGYEIEIVC